MKKIIFTALATTALALPQAHLGTAQTGVAAPQLSSQPSASSRSVEAARPLLGYVTNGSNVLYSVVGSPSSPSWGEPLSLPDPGAVVFLPPRQEYALLSTGAGLYVARLSRSAVQAGALIPDAVARPSAVAFSPSAEAAALYSNAEGRIQVLTYVGGNARLSWSAAVPASANPLRMAISDDGKLLVAFFPDQAPVYSLAASPWQPIATDLRPDAWSFLPNSHNLVLSDQTQKTVALLSQIEHAPGAQRTLASGDLDANLLSPNKQGTKLLAAATGSAACWSIDLASGSITSLPVSSAVDALTLLRDGQTFLVSLDQSPLLVKLSGEAVSHPAAAALSR